MRDKLLAFAEEAKAAIGSAQDESKVKDLRVKYLGRNGIITGILRSLKQLDERERPIVGKLANEVKDQIQSLIDRRLSELQELTLEAQLREESIDVTLPGRRIVVGKTHPLTKVLSQIESIFTSMGFEVVEGPEIEDEYHCFEALNIPKDHPARDMQDTFFVGNETVLRTHTSSVQIRTMEARRPPIKIIAPGRVYRRDSDATHSPMFHQVEGLYVDRNVTFGDLKGTLMAFCRQMFGETVGVRFRPSYFPYTEPSAEVDISCVFCGGRGCRLCKESGWLEILGSGMVHPAVFEAVGYDPEEYTGFAFGMGPERIAMLKYGINDIRLFYENDLRFLKQF
ncbi:MAG: phenylalanine--tRNA ligase subunit alpha [bacterium]